MKLLALFLLPALGAALDERTLRSVATKTSQHALSRTLEDENFNGYSYEDENGNSCSFDFDTGSYTCNICVEIQADDANSQYCMQQTCATTSDDMACDICTTLTVENSDESTEFCYTTFCDLSVVLSGTMEEACGCESASLNGRACSHCAFCSTDDYEYDLSSSSADKIAQGLSLQCPIYSEQEEEWLTTECPVSKTTAQTNWGGIALGGFAIVGAVALLAWFTIKKQTEVEQQEVFTADYTREGVAA